MLEQFLSPTTERHNLLTSMLMHRIFPMIEQNSAYAVQEQIPLVHYGEKRKGGWLSLVDVSQIIDTDEFIDSKINDLEYILPDFMMFKENNYLKNRKRTKIAGCPDLLVEVWSDSNTEEEQIFKMELYSMSNTEHWYIMQDSNKVECWLGKRKLSNQYLSNILKTQKGIEFDLRYLALT